VGILEEFLIALPFYQATRNHSILSGTIVEYMMASKIRFDLGCGGDVFFPQYAPDLEKKILHISRYIFKWGFFRFGRLLFRISFLPPDIPLIRVQREFPFEVIHPYNTTGLFQSFPEARLLLKQEVPRNHESHFLANSFSLFLNN
jgi:hypothetical protein